MQVSNKAVRAEGRLLAYLGPTNTGKTHRAIERMLSYESGMIGFPLRLLARENYEKIVAEKGRHLAALITGEEKIIPKQAKYFCCTVESMPVQRDFEFVGIDEVQLAQDPDRGHVFTDRILRARGLDETVFMGSDTMKTVLSRLVPNIQFEACNRFSLLSYTGYKKLTRLPKRSAIVAFSMDDVYNMAELIRRQRGGTAVVLGALSPRTRNKQVEMYQSGEVDFMVATDAIGMGLNMDIHHVALASSQKFDGHRLRPLKNHELAQIAGRAGRYMRDGTFGITSRVNELDEDTIKAIENHNFDSVREICWRNVNLDFSSPKMLLKSLELPSGDKMLIKGRASDDYLALKAMIEREDIMVRASKPEQVRLLWDVCQIPDFRQTLNDQHQELIANIYTRLSDNLLQEDWVSKQIRRLDDVKGDVDALMNRISHVRTWTYIAFKSEWLERVEHWQETTRAIEDRLSDALHEALIKRFVDRRASVLMKSLEDGKQILAGIRSNGEVIVESHLIGHLYAFRFIPIEDAVGVEYKTVMQAARNALNQEVKRRIGMILTAKPEQFTLDETGQILWQQKYGSPLPGDAVAILKSSDNVLKPELELIDTDLLSGSDKDEVLKFLKLWLDTHIKTVLEPLVALENQDNIQGTARGIVYQVYENMGIVPREKLESLIAELTSEDRASLRGYKIKMGPILVFLPALNKPAAVRLRALLWALHRNRTLPVEVPKDGIVSMTIDKKSVDRHFYQSIGYPVFGGRAIRIDMLDRVISAVYDLAEKGKFQAQHKMAEWLGCPIEDLYDVLQSMGHKKIFDPADQKSEEELSVSDLHVAPANKDEEDKQQDDKETDAQIEKDQAEQKSDNESDASAKLDENTTPKEEQEKPELAVFRLKKGKAFEKPFKEHKPHKHKNAKGKKQRGNPKGKDYKKSKMTAEAKVKDDSPFAVLEQLKKNADG